MARPPRFEVTHLEREPAPRGASVRDSGLVQVSGRAPGAEPDLALRARDRWVVVVTGAGGRGITCAPAIASDTFERFGWG